jgi:hypothetical protein
VGIYSHIALQHAIAFLRCNMSGLSTSVFLQQAP